MHRFRFSLIAVLVIFVLVGQGCFSLGTQQEARDDGGVFKSLDAGQTWEQRVAYPTPKGVQQLKQLSVDNLTIDPQDSNVIYLGSKGSGLLYSEDAAVSWERPRNSALRNGEVEDISVDPTDVCTVYFVKSKNLHKTDDCLRSADNEVYVETRSRVAIESVEVDWFDPSVVWLGLSNGDLLKSTNGGDTWSNVMNVGSDVTDIIVNLKDSRRIMVATDGDGFYTTRDGGGSWTQFEEGLEDWRGSEDVRHLSQSNNSGVVVAASDYGLLRSFDFGQSWEPIELLTAPGDVDILGLAVDPQNADRIYYTADSTFYRTKDGGGAWTTKQIPTTKLVEAIAVNPEDSDVVYTGAGSAK
jgi:photosystem II stability/assembly factor-like uncharacterized protein